MQYAVCQTRCYKDATLRPAVGWTQPTGRHIGEILQRPAVARGGLESVCETMVSVMEAHTPSLRGILDQRRLEDEILVAWNGEDVFHCDQVQ